MQKIALISIKPKFANQILFGVKKFEYRKRSMGDDTTHIMLYMTAPVMRIVGMATIKKIHSGAPSAIWEKTKSRSGITRSFYRAYFKNSKTAYAIELDTVTPFQWVDPRELDNNFRAPQSFKYIDNAFAHKVLHTNQVPHNRDNNILFFAGIHGVGKSTIGNKLKKDIGIKMFSASQLIKDGEGKIGTDKRVENIGGNQEILLSQLREKSDLGLFILDGHFSLVDKCGTIKSIPLDVFEQINPREIFLLEADVELIYDRLYARDNTRYDIDLLQDMLDTEREHALYVSKMLKIPIKIITNDEYSMIKDYIENL